MNIKENEIKQLLEKYQKFAVYGLSPDLHKPSHYVPLYMRDRGWQMVGTYPEVHADSGFEIFSTLGEVPLEYRKFINVFRGSSVIPRVVDEVLDLGDVEVLWLQLGITHPEAEARAERAGIKVVSNRCLIIEHQKYFS